MEVSDVSTDVGVRVQASKTLLTKIHVLLAKWYVATTLCHVSTDFKLLIPWQDSRTSDKAAPQLYFSKKEFYHSRRISVILLHTIAKCLIALSLSTSLGSQQEYRIWIQLVTAIVLHTHKTLLCPLPDLWLSLFLKFIPYMNCAFSLDPDPVMSLRGTRTSARTCQWDMTAVDALSCLWYELKRSVDKSGHLDDAKQIVS